LNPFRNSKEERDKSRKSNSRSPTNGTTIPKEKTRTFGNSGFLPVKRETFNPYSVPDRNSKNLKTQVKKFFPGIKR